MIQLEISIRQWQEQFKAGAYNSPDGYTQFKAGWHDWACKCSALAGRLKKVAKVVMGITSPFILDQYYVRFENAASLSGPLYDSIHFEPLSENRDEIYFRVILNYPRQKAKWTLISERYDFETPEFVCDSVRDMVRYVNKLGTEFENGVPSPLIREEHAVAVYVASQPDLQGAVGPHRMNKHTYSVFIPSRNSKEFIHTALCPDCAPAGFQVEQAVQIDGIYVSRHDRDKFFSQNL